MEENNEQKESKESITLTKNAKGEYQWIIKVKDEILTIEGTLDRLDEIDGYLKANYGKK